MAEERRTLHSSGFCERHRNATLPTADRQVQARHSAPVWSSITTRTIMDDMTLSGSSLVARSGAAPITDSIAAPRAVVRAASKPHAQACTGCRVRHLCLPAQFSEDAVVRFNDTIPMRHRVDRGARVFRSGESFTSLFAIRVGFFKSYAVTEDGAMQTIGFPMPGDLLGLAGIAAGRHMHTLEALGYGEVCQIPYASVSALASGMPEVRDAMHKTLAHAIHRNRRC